jgi:archaeosine-15-forming tRNA-guanine transglycosylase
VSALIVRRASASEVSMLRSIANYQFGYPAGELLVPDDAIVAVSPATRRIREVHGEEGLLAVLRAHDYLFSLSVKGAQRLLKLEEPRLRAKLRVPGDELKTKSINCRLVAEVDPELLPGDEVIVIGSDGRLIGVGRLRLSPGEVSEPKCWGEAIRLRHRAEKT